jgi:colicin import membrane protein
MSFIRQHKGAVVWSLALHIAVAAAVVIGLPWRIERPRVPVAAAAPIQGVIIDQAAIEKERAAQAEAARQERQRVQREEQQKREAAAREEQRVAAATRAREQAELEERERVAAELEQQRRREREAQAERERQAREREEQAQRDREAAERRAREEAEQRRRQQAESDLQQQLALEAERNAARDAGLLDQYTRMLENKIKQHWDRPLSARPGIDCVVTVVQLPTGDVVSARVASCNGDDAVRRSIERAVMDASPLPKPPNPALFERNLNVTFQPDE